MYQSLVRLEMLWDILLKDLQMALLNSHLFLHLQNFLLFRIIIHPCHSTEFQPPIILLIISKLPQHYVNRIPIVTEYNIVGNAQLDQLIGNQAKHKG